MDGAFGMVVPPKLCSELERVFASPKIARRVTEREASELLDLLRRQAGHAADPGGTPAVRSPDPDDDYLISLAETAGAMIVSRDAHPLGLADHIPVCTPAAFLAVLPARES